MIIAQVNFKAAFTTLTFLRDIDILRLIITMDIDHVMRCEAMMNIRGCRRLGHADATRDGQHSTTKFWARHARIY